MDLESIRKELKDGDAILLDVRELDEWNLGHLSLAHLYPLSKLEKDGFDLDIPPNKTVYLHCRRGGRAERAAAILKTQEIDAIPLMHPFEDLQKMDF